MKISDIVRKCEAGFLGVNEENQRRAWELLDVEIRMFSILVLEVEIIGLLTEEVRRNAEEFKGIRPVYLYRKRALHLLTTNRFKTQEYLMKKLALAQVKLFAFIQYCEKKGFEKLDVYADPIYRYLDIVENMDRDFESLMERLDLYKISKSFINLNIDRKSREAFINEKNDREDKVVDAYLKRNGAEIIDRTKVETLVLENEYRLSLFAEKLKNAYVPVELERTMFRDKAHFLHLFISIHLLPGEDAKKKHEEIKARILEMDAPGLELNCDEYVQEKNQIFIITRLKYTNFSSYEFPLNLKYLDSIKG